MLSTSFSKILHRLSLIKPLLYLNNFIYVVGSAFAINNHVGFFKGAQVGGRTWDLFYFRFIFSHKQRLRPLGYYAPFTIMCYLFPFNNSIKSANQD